MNRVSVACLLASFVSAAPAFADFSGQPILGPLSLGSSIAGNNTGAGDENDGFFSGDHIFDIWDGGDDVYRLDWLGGNMTVSMFYESTLCDPDLFLYTPGSLDESSIYGITGLSPDVVSFPSAPAGTYYILVDSTAGAEGAYELTVTPTPGTASVLIVAGLLAGRRRR